MKIVLKLGGFLFSDKPDLNIIRDYTREIQRVHRQNNRIIVVTGGGLKARQYIDIVRDLKGDESLCDIIGIQVSRINANILITGLNDEAFPDVPENLGELKNFFQHGKIVVTGGLQPGQSTNAVAALAAEAIRADLIINLTDVDGVYSKDPDKFKDARKFDEIKIDDLERLILKTEVSAGNYKLYDPLAVKIISRSKIPTIIANGKTVQNLSRIISGKKIGTRIVY